jgi:protein TonB
MKRALLLLLLIVPGILASAQQTPTQQRGDPNAEIVIDEPIGNSFQKPLDDPNKIYIVIDEIPRFPGGLDNYLQVNLKYPAEAKSKNIEGKVFLRFVVEKDGSLTDIKVLRSLSPDCNAEAVRVMKACPKWRPGILNGKPVRVAFTVPIEFQLPDKD